MGVVKYSDNSKNNSYKLKKRTAIVISFGLTLSLSIGGIVWDYKKPNYEIYDTDTKAPSYETYVTNISVPTYNYSIPVYVDDRIAFEVQSGEDPPVEANPSNINVSLSNTQYNNFISYLESLDNSYKYESIYKIEEAVSKYAENNISAHSGDITNGTGILTADMLYEKVLNNNEWELDINNPNRDVGLKKIKSKCVRKVCEMLVDCINTEIAINPNINKQEVFCILDDLRILERNVSFSNAYFDENNVLVVDEDNIERYQNFNEEVDAFRQVIYHESMHIIQSYCKDREKDNEYKMGICYDYEELDVNPFFWSWFLEAAAEKEMARVLNEKPNTYSAPIGYYDSIILCSILNKDVSVSDVESICFNKKTGSLFKIFNASSDAEKEEIIKMMYSIEIMQSSPDDFFKLYKEKYGIDLDYETEELENLRLSLRVDILKTLTKEFYKSLANQLLNGSMTLETANYIINVYESDVFIHLFFNETERIKSAVDFFNYYTEVQDKFFEVVSISNGISYGRIVDEFENYSMNVSINGNQVKNYDASFLGEQDFSFIDKKRMQNYQTGIPNIRTMPDFCKKQGYSN